MTKTNHTIRIISGTHRSRRLPVLDFDGLRPTGDRVRETLFNWLQLHLAGRKVLDLCAGAGSLGFEAASRGANHVLMIENNERVAKQLQRIIEDFKFENITVQKSTAQEYLRNNSKHFDVIFLDPPFSAGLMQELTELSLELVKAGGYLYREAGVEQELIKLPQNWELYRQKSMGQVKIELWQKKSIEIAH
jgi:16S rRNA (guanine966-N2)-methyltransferase